MNKYICIHGHFYQPPRENPWLESIELQDSAYPFHDWNARISAECYGPNSTSRILTPDGKIRGIMNNYGRISFNMGPTLLSWMQDAEPIVYEAVQEGDRQGAEQYGGHGTAIAQVYNHVIMPLADEEDKRLSVEWGLADFRMRFGRDPEGMWLAETAADIASLDALAERDIKYTIMAPRQAHRVRPIGSDEWMDVGDGRVDPRRPYLCNLPSGRSIAIFFYDGPIAQDLAFGGMLNSGEAFAARLLSAFGEAEGDEPLLVHVAADGETFGHHHKHGEMALSSCIHRIEESGEAEFTVYGEFLEKFPPKWEVEIWDNSSWSCVHGVERWKSNCGCCSGMKQGWHQQWRGPLREALDLVRDNVKRVYTEKAANVFADPQGALNRYIAVILDRTAERAEQFLQQELREGIELNDETRQEAMRLLESRRQSILMYTSCGWFFDELSGLETTQVMRYAARAIQLLRDLSGTDIERDFIERLAQAPSNLGDLKDGGEVYRRYVKPSAVDLRRVAIHYAVSSIFEEFGDETKVFAFAIKRLRNDRLSAGRLTLALGEVELQSLVTFDKHSYEFVVLHLGDQNLTGGINELGRIGDFAALTEQFKEVFSRSDVPALIRLIDQNFDTKDFSFWNLFVDQQRKIMQQIFRESENSIEAFYRQVYREQYPMMSAMQAMGMPLPRILKNTVDYVLNRDLLHELETLPVSEEKFSSIREEIRKWNSQIDGDLIGFVGARQLALLANKLTANPLDLETMREMSNLLRKYQEIGAPMGIWYTQDAIYDIGRQQFSIRKYLAEQGDEFTSQWVTTFEELSDLAGVHIE